ncbi:MAG TPA: 1-deoxy-D-xylulose-5-phosphate reductoisomerase [Terriglobales bacterium]|nr:1-deoxy-D-xylulose-5-phosphate reductoisomerase [Terriglobales bacterium]
MDATIRRLALLGSTGSIGQNTLDVIAGFADRFIVHALCAGDNIAKLAEQVERWRPKLAVVRTSQGADQLRKLLTDRGVAPLPEIAHGEAGLLAAVAAPTDLVVAATVGVAALGAIAAALAGGRTVALANKEALVVAGELLLGIARQSGAQLLPIDSEHSAIHQCLRGSRPGEVARLILTASGGPFLRYSVEQLATVTPDQARRHPTWNMGSRISLDSATLMNKGFEVIEACHLFSVAESQVAVLVHPQSIVHSMVEFSDGSTLAQLGTADMRTPIQYALTYPDRLPSNRKRLNLEEMSRLDFELPDHGRFPCLGLARQALQAGGGAPAALNAADEVAVAAFLQGRIPFTRIAGVVDETLSQIGAPPIASIEAVLEADARARRVAQSLL